MKLVLASKSAGRRKLLRDCGVKFSAVESHFEEVRNLNLKPQDYAKAMALGKAKNIYERMRGRDVLIMGFDTVGAMGKKIMGKPKDSFEAKKFLREMSDNAVKVITGVAIIDAVSGKTTQDFCMTEVVFRKLSLAEIDAYVATGNALDVAGGLRIEHSVAPFFVKEIRGDYNNVIGVPLYQLGQILERDFKYNILTN